MAENHGFQQNGEDDGVIHVETTHDDKTPRKKSVEIGTATTQIVIETEPHKTRRDCWDATWDLLGTRQSEYIQYLRPIGASLFKMQESLKIFQYELERDVTTRTTATNAINTVHECIKELNSISAHDNLNIPPDEHANIRNVTYQLVLVGRMIEEIAANAPVDSARSRKISYLNLRAVVPQQGGLTKPDDETKEEPKHTASVVDIGSLRESLTNCHEVVENFIKYIDKKTERRWWLRDVIGFTQAAVKVALFISAAISVAYHENQIAPIITLIITCIQGITEGLDQYFVKKRSPTDIQITIPTSGNKN